MYSCTNNNNMLIILFHVLPILLLCIVKMRRADGGLRGMELCAYIPHRKMPILPGEYIIIIINYLILFYSVILHRTSFDQFDDASLLIIIITVINNDIILCNNAICGCV